MKKLFCSLPVFVFSMLTCTLFADFTLDLGSIDSSQTFILAVSPPTNSDSTFELIDSNDQVVVYGTIQAVWTGVGPEYYDYVSSGTANLAGVVIAPGGYRGTDLEISGLPLDNYRLKSYTSWGTASTSLQLYGPYFYGNTTNFGTVDEYYSNIVFFDLFVF